VEIIDRKMSGLNKPGTDCRRVAAKTGNKQIKTGLLQDIFLQEKISKISYGAQQVKNNDNKNKNFHVYRPLRASVPLTVAWNKKNHIIIRLFAYLPGVTKGHCKPHLFIINISLCYTIRCEMGCLPFGPIDVTPLMIRTHTLHQKFQKVRN
jgi:hypothetical protein